MASPTICAARYHRLKAQGLCTNCGLDIEQERAAKKRTRCRICSDKPKLWYHPKKAERDLSKYVYRHNGTVIPREDAKAIYQRELRQKRPAIK